MIDIQDNNLKKIISHSKEYGFVFPSSEIYDGLSAIYDYGPYGVELKNNLKEYWWKSMVQLNDNILGIDSSIFMHSSTWKASGHIDAFNDPLIDNKDSKKRYRADVLIEDHIGRIKKKKEKEILKAKKRFKEDFDEKKFCETSPRVLKYIEEIEKISTQLNDYLKSNNLNGLKDLIISLGISDPISGTKNWTDVRQFNLMFSTDMGSVDSNKNLIYLRPETAQGIFLNFLNVINSSRMRIPFGIAQIGKAFRNEIIARQFIFRMREFEQMEMQFFVTPNYEIEWYKKWKNTRIKWHHILNLGKDRYRFHDHKNLAHYANAACDIEFNFPMGYKELEGIHSRTDFDLKAHQKLSGKKLTYFDQKNNKAFLPYVIETSIGLDRLFLAVLSGSYIEESLDDGSNRVYLKIPFPLAPIKVAVLPLNAKDKLPDKAKEIYNQLKIQFSSQYDEKDSIGKRYRRQDAIGTPFCITIDYESLETNKVTVRNRDSMQQERISVDKINKYLENNTSLNILLNQLD